MASHFYLLASFLMIHVLISSSRAQLNPDFYNEICPQALPTIRMVVEEAVALEPRMGASLLRLHFHDCFVNGCDGSILLDDTPTFIGEKTAAPNNNSVRGFGVIDKIKAAVNSACSGNVVSCADIVAVAARDSVVALGGASYAVQVGRRDSTTASREAADNGIPSPFLSFQGLLSNFQSHGLTVQDLIVLSGGHTIGQARCINFRTRIYNETNIDTTFARNLRFQCPLSGGDNNLAPLDETPTRFDSVYYEDLMEQKGLLHSDQQLFMGDGSESDVLVRRYSGDMQVFWEDFGVSMLKMGNLLPLTGDLGQIRENCRRVNK